VALQPGNARRQACTGRIHTRITFELGPEEVNPPGAGAPSADEVDSFYAKMASLAGSMN